MAESAAGFAASSRRRSKGTLITHCRSATCDHVINEVRGGVRHAPAIAARANAAELAREGVCALASAAGSPQRRQAKLVQELEARERRASELASSPSRLPEQ